MKTIAKVYFLSFWLLVACNSNPPTNSYLIPEGFPEMPVPQGNEYTQERWLLGKKLFYENRLSFDSSVNCASCHQPKAAFASRNKFNKGASAQMGNRNAPTLANIGYHPYFLREGSVPSLEMQINVPIQEHHEFNMDMIKVIDRLKNDATYNSLSQQAYGQSIDPYVVSRALANFERSLISGNSRYDKYQFQGKKEALSKMEIAGMQLFFSDSIACSSCHSGFNFSNYAFENNGLYTSYADQGRLRFTNDSLDMARFKVPTLRNVAVTPPYMHDGSLNSLEEVIEHYSEGIKDHPSKNALLKNLYLSTEQKLALVAFLKILTDSSFIANPKFSSDVTYD